MYINYSLATCQGNTVCVQTSITITEVKLAEFAIKIEN